MIHVKKPKRGEPTQPTKPARGEPVEIPIPTRGDVLRDLERTAKPLDQRRNDPEFREKLDRAVERNRDALDKLAD